ncbi:MAG: sulfatase-like hydrolase/transferase [Chloroflexota bacterium]
MQPNILLIVTDQEYAHPQLPNGYRLPNHDRLKAQGVTFNHFQATTTLCTPSRACLYTGQHTPNNGMVDNANYCFVGAMSTEIPTMGDMLREQGYETAYKGKWHLGQLSYEATTAVSLEPYGFSDFQENGDTHGLAQEGAQRDAQIADDASKWLLERKTAEKPFLLAVNFINPHDVMFFNCGEGHIQGRFNIAGLPDGEHYQQQWDVSLPDSFFDDEAQQPAILKTYRAVTEYTYGRIPDDQTNLWKKFINYHLNCLLDVDRQMGKVLDALEASGQANNTIIVYTSDHGELAGAHRLAQKGMVAFRELVNVPLIVVHPNGAKGEQTDAVGSLVDLIPTMLSWAGCGDVKAVCPQLVGWDLTAVVTDPTHPGPRGNPTKRGHGALFTYDNLSTNDTDWFKQNINHILEIDGVGQRLNPAQYYVRDINKIFDIYGKPKTHLRHMMRGIFDGRFKLIRHFAIDNYHLPQTVADLLANNDVALYDLVTDPHETINLARPDYPDYDESLLGEMNEKLNRLILAEIGDDNSPYGL